MVNYEISPEDQAKIDALNNPKVEKCIKEAAELMKPKEVIVIDDTPEDIARIRQLSIDIGEERPLKMEGHTIHFDGWVTNSNHDQARDKAHTATLLPKGQTLSRGLNVVEREEGLKEIMGFMDGAMKGKIMIVRFFCLGPTHSIFSIPALQITDSTYVAHSEDILYRIGYEIFKNMVEDKKDDFFYLWHTAGQLNERGNTADLTKRRIYIDPLENRVLTAYNQYAGNSLGLKKLCLRLAIWKANNEDWLAEHMFIAGYSRKNKDRMTYFAGAYPSACGKTSTAMIPGSSIIGDDIAYLRKNDKGELMGVNIESGIFGIIKDVNPDDDPEIFKVLTTPRELIFSNILINDGKPYWLGMGKETPDEGENFSGQWKRGNKDANGSEILPAHPNARYTIRISDLENADPNLHNPDGVKIEGIFYGGRDSDTTVPVVEALSWEHGVFMGATLESETTSATIGKTGVRNSSPMANMDFIIIPLGEYLTHHIEYGKSLKSAPKVYNTNYFLKSPEGKYLNGILDKKVWVLWAEGRVNGDFDAIKTPIGYLPKYEDLQQLFKDELEIDYSKEDYIQQFSIRCDGYLEKFARMKEIYKNEPKMPKEFWDVMNQQVADVEALKAEKGAEVSPFAM